MAAMLKIRTVELLIDGHRHKRLSPTARYYLARRILAYRQRTPSPRPILGRAG